MLAVFERFLVTLSRVLAVIGLTGLLVLAVMTLTDGLLRSLANHPVDAVRDMGGMVAAMSVACCLPIALLERSNITIRFLGAFFGRGTGEAAERFAAIVVLLLVAAMARQFFLFSRDAASNGDATWILNIPTAPFWYVVDTMFGIAMLAQFLVTVRVLQGRSVPVPRLDVH
ncbi:MAG: transporter small permease protein [Rhodopila sp.]|nr:transporter small permease protein [Rhodopila sp.]